VLPVTYTHIKASTHLPILPQVAPQSTTKAPIAPRPAAARLRPSPAPAAAAAEPAGAVLEIEGDGLLVVLLSFWGLGFVLETQIGRGNKAAQKMKMTPEPHPYIHTRHKAKTNATSRACSKFPPMASSMCAAVPGSAPVREQNSAT
jgi:hypothetical protein